MDFHGYLIFYTGNVKLKAFRWNLATTVSEPPELKLFSKLNYTEDHVHKTVYCVFKHKGCGKSTVPLE